MQLLINKEDNLKLFKEISHLLYKQKKYYLT